MRLDYETDGGTGTRARLGLVVLRTDETIEQEFRRLLGPGDAIALHCARIPNDDQVTPGTLADMEARIPETVRTLPAGAPLDVVGYACTSGATVIGSANVARAVRGARPADGPGSLARTAVSDPLLAVKAACAALGARRIGFVTPYVAEVSAAMRSSLEADGIEIAAFGSFGQGDDRVVARISPRSVRDAILRVGRAAPCDAVFVSCTNVRTFGVLADAEEGLGRPVVSSNQALAWHMLRSAGVRDAFPGLGRLFDEADLPGAAGGAQSSSSPS